MARSIFRRYGEYFLQRLVFKEVVRYRVIVR